MVSFLLAGYIFIAISLLLIGTLTILRNGSNKLNRIFFILTISVACWIITNYFSNDVSISRNMAFLANHLVLFFAGLSLLLIYVFIALLIRVKSVYHIRSIYGVFILIYAITLTPLVVKDIVLNGAVYDIKFGLLANLYFLTLLINVIAIFGTLIHGIRHSVGAEKARLVIILWTIAIWAFINLVTNALLPIFGGSFGLTSVGPLTSIFLVAGLAYSIVKHQLFDIKVVILRSLGYLLSLGVLVLIYAFTVFFLLQNVVNTDDISQGWQQAIYVALLLITALIFQKVKGFFDRVTNRIFYKDAYDPQEFLDQLNKSILSNIEIGILLRRTTGVIKDNLKCSYCYVVLHETHNGPMRAIGTQKADFSQLELEALQEGLESVQGRVVFVNDIPEHMKPLKKMYSRHNIDFIVHLKTNSYGSEQTVAYLIFGPKNNGNIYSDQDLRIIDIVSGELIIAIQNALRFEEIQEFNVTLQKNVNDATGKLKRTNEKLKALDETKDEFISMASHQLRTPLTSVKGYLSMVLEGDVGQINDDQRRLLDQAFVSSQRMVYLIADLLNVSRLRTGKFVISTHATNLADVVDSEISSLREQARTKNLQLDFDKPDDFPLLMIDETKIRQVIMNFVDNAIFYTPSGGRITIKLSSDKTHVYFIVKDNGVGVPKEDQKHMFTKFYRGRNARQLRPDGTGLGLFMAKKVIEAQGGNILFESTEGKGSSFGFSFNKKHLAKALAEDTVSE